ncbi:MAG: hypothetical protein AB1500_03745 [Bacillota bacterium]
MPPSLELYNELKNMIEDTIKREKECGEYLKHIPEFLFNETFKRVVYSDIEYRGNTGNADFVISAEVITSSGISTVKAYVYELKAPQCYIFERDNNERLKPSKDLISAENQLINYHDEMRSSDQFRDKYKVMHPDNVCIGGIIIGCSRFHVKGNYPESKKEVLYEGACRIRDHYFYRSCPMKLITWDMILRQFIPRKEIVSETIIVRPVELKWSVTGPTIITGST